MSEIVKKSKLVLKGEKHGKKKKKKQHDKDKKKTSDSNAPVVDEDRINHGKLKEREVAMPRPEMGSFAEEEKRRGIRPLKSVARIRQIYAEALQKVFNEFDETDPSYSAFLDGTDPSYSALLEETDPSYSAFLDKEWEALATVEVVAASFESASRTLNPLMLRMVCANGLQCCKQLAAMLPEWFIMLRMQVERMSQEVERMRQEVEKERSARLEAQAEVRRLLEVESRLQAQLQDAVATSVGPGRTTHAESTRKDTRKRRHSEKGSSSRSKDVCSRGQPSAEEGAAE